VLIVDDNRFFAECLAALINSERDLQVCGTAASSATLYEILNRCSPEGIVLDLMLGAESGLKVALDLRNKKIDTPVFFISALATPSPDMLKRIGRCSFWRKSGDDVEFLNLLRRTLTSEPDDADELSAKAPPGGAKSRAARHRARVAGALLPRSSGPRLD